MANEPSSSRSAQESRGTGPDAGSEAALASPWTLRAVSAPGAVGVAMLRTACLLILALLATMGAMYLLRRVLVPFVLAVFLSLLVSPIINGMMHRLRWPRAVAVIVTFVLATLLLMLVIATVLPAAVGLINRADQYTVEAQKLVDDGISFVAGVLPAKDIEAIPPATEGEPAARADPVAGLDPRADMETQLREAFEQQIYPEIGALVVGFAGNLMNLATNGVLVGIFLLFLLLGRGDKPIRPDSLRGQIESRVQGYIFIMLIISALTGLLVGLTLELLGVPLGWVFGVAAFVLNFIPNIGSIIATLLPLPVVLFNPELSATGKVLAFLIPTIIQFIVGNLLAPKLLGDRLEISPVVVLLGLIFFGTIWGLAGMILAAPMLAVVKIAFERIPTLSPVADALAGRWTTAGLPPSPASPASAGAPAPPAS